jgi:beta-lactamase regulating signal transducer with metallopeptidase domain
MNHHLESLGWTLLHFCWQAGAIALVYWLAETALSKARSQTRYVLALAALLMMLIAALATFTYEESTNRPDSRIPSAVSFLTARTAVDASGLAGQIDIDALASSNRPSQWPMPSLLTWLDMAWLAGVACLSMRTLVGLQMIRRLRRRSLMKAPEAVRVNFSIICRRLGISRKVRLRVAEHIQGPFAMGVFRTMILLPASALVALTPEQLEVVLMHELAHVRRADYFWNLMQRAIETLFFFHPAVWWVGKKLRQERELCCDDMAVQLCSDPLVYATALLRLEEQRCQRPTLAMALDGNRPLSSLRMRIARVLGETLAEQERRELTPLPVVAICAALLLVLFSVPQLFAVLPGKKNLSQSVPSASTAMSAPAPVIATNTTAVTTPIALNTAIRSAVAANADTAARTIVNSTATANADTVVKTIVRTAIAHADDIAVNNSSMFVDAPGALRSDDVRADGGAAQQESAHKADYIDSMRAAGYDVDIDKYVAMKVQGVTPEYARDMAKAGFGKPSADDLIALKVQGVTPEYVASLRSAGLAPTSLGDLVSYRIFKVTPEFVTGMKSAGFDAIPPDKLIALRVHNITPEYAKMVRQQYPSATIDQLMQLRIFHIDDAFIAAAKRHGFTSLSIDKLVQLRISGIMNDDESEAK